jgi:hypothetical protein
MAEHIRVSVCEGASNKYAIGMAVTTDERGNTVKVLTGLTGDLPKQSASIGSQSSNVTNNTAAIYEGPPEYAARALANVKSIKASVVAPGARVGGEVSGNVAVGVYCGDFAALMAEREKKRNAGK